MSLLQQTGIAYRIVRNDSNHGIRYTVVEIIEGDYWAIKEIVDNLNEALELRK